MKKTSIAFPVRGRYYDDGTTVRTEITVRVECDIDFKNDFPKCREITLKSKTQNLSYEEFDFYETNCKWHEWEVANLIDESDIGLNLRWWMETAAKDIHSQKQAYWDSIFEISSKMKRLEALEDEDKNKSYRFLIGGHKGISIDYFDFDVETLKPLHSLKLSKVDRSIGRELSVNVTSITLSNVTWKTEVLNGCL